MKLLSHRDFLRHTHENRVGFRLPECKIIKSGRVPICCYNDVPRLPYMNMNTFLKERMKVRLTITCRMAVTYDHAHVINIAANVQ